MSDSRRFNVVGRFFARQFPDRSLRIGDVAGGAAGFMRQVLNGLGYMGVITIDPAGLLYSGNRAQVQRCCFDAEIARKLKLDAIVALHPDAATDHAVMCGLPGVILPCCVLPNLVPVKRRLDEQAWLRHLQRLAGARCALTTRLDIQGQNIAMVLR
jgi:hypothetical protein